MTSVFVPTHEVDVLRGQTTDAYGDAADTDTVIAAAVPVSIVETVRREQEPVSGTPRSIRYARGRARPQTDVRDGDRWRDVRSLAVWQVEGVSDRTDLYAAADIVVDLKRIT
ncbi:hypothetical protein [Parafrankia discariae]|uniref:hypothetical protein n=1 Tax=Parafrankia discariae TaxID=365528 RepID=UPI000360EF93|nr:hypothetical protein [Parafrankia discariae]